MVFNFFKKTDGNDLEEVVKPKRANFLTQFLPEDEDKKAALARSLLSAGANMMIAGGPSTKPVNFMQVLGSGLAGGVGSYDEALKAQQEVAKQRQAAQAAQQAQERRVQLLDSFNQGGGGGDQGDFGYNIAQLKEYFKYQVETGDEAGARYTLGMIQKLQQEAAGKGMVVGDGGNLELAPGYGEGLGAVEQHKAAGRVQGEEAYRQTDDIREYNLYVEQAKQAGIEPTDFTTWMRESKKAGATNVTVEGQNSDKFREETDKKAAERIAGYVESGATAPNMIADMDLMVDLSKQIGTGKTAEFMLKLGPYAEMAGIKIDGLSEAQAFDAVASRLAPQMRPAGAGATSDFDAKQYLKSLPALANTPEGNELIAYTNRAIAENKIAAAEIAAKSQRGEITWQDAEAQIRALPNPYERFKSYGKDDESNKNKAAVPVISNEKDYETLPNGATYRFPGDPENTRRIKR